VPVQRNVINGRANNPVFPVDLGVLSTVCLSTWRLLHYTSYAAFMLVTAHGLTAGTDSQKLGFQLLFGASVLLTVILLGYRIGVKRSSRGKPSQARPAARVAPRETA
jgi:hypothetical protein